LLEFPPGKEQSARIVEAKKPASKMGARGGQSQWRNRLPPKGEVGRFPFGQGGRR